MHFEFRWVDQWTTTQLGINNLENLRGILYSYCQKYKFGRGSFEMIYEYINAQYLLCLNILFVFKLDTSIFNFVNIIITISTCR